MNCDNCKRLELELAKAQAAIKHFNDSEDSSGIIAIPYNDTTALDAATRIYTRCPACKNDTITINDKHLLCTWIDCPDPTLIEHLEKAIAAAQKPLVDAIEKALTMQIGSPRDVLKDSLANVKEGK
jgi:hypothetical protein